VSESNYQYDQKGRIISITGDPLGTSTFEYDDNGRKTLILSSDRNSAPALGSTAISFSVLEQDDPYFPMPSSGQVKISYNRQDRPVEWRVSDASGNLVNRLIRAYDEHGRLTELRYTIENLLSSLPADAQQQLMAEPGAAEEMAAQLTKLLGEQRTFARMTYMYDADGRLIEQRQYIGHSMEDTTRITYNDHSDKLEEHTLTTGDPNQPRDSQSGEPQSSAPPTQKSHVRYSYKYDTFGNWTEQASSPSIGPDVATVTRRNIIYY
jgi:YD repeat-containing protein